MAKTIQELRRERGYRSAREFADALGISPSSMSRYDNQPESIPTKVAWEMADLLGCSIDEVVGRERVTSGKSEIQEFYDGLSPESRALFNEFCRFVSEREERSRMMRKTQDDRKWERLAQFYERMFNQAIFDQMDSDYLSVFDQPWMLRDAIEDFVEEKTEEARCRSARKFAKKTIEEMKQSGEYEKGEPNVEAKPGDSDYDMELEDYLYHIALDHDEATEGSVKGVTKRIMAAYDRLHPEDDEGYSYAFVKLDD